MSKNVRTIAGTNMGDCHRDIDDMKLEFEGKGANGDVNGGRIAYVINIAVFCCVCERVCDWRKRETSCVCSPWQETRQTAFKQQRCQ